MEKLNTVQKIQTLIPLVTMENNEISKEVKVKACKKMEELIDNL